MTEVTKVAVVAGEEEREGRRRRNGDVNQRTDKANIEQFAIWKEEGRYLQFPGFKGEYRHQRQMLCFSVQYS